MRPFLGYNLARQIGRQVSPYSTPELPSAIPIQEPLLPKHTRDAQSSLQDQQVTQLHTHSSSFRTELPYGQNMLLPLRLLTWGYLFLFPLHIPLLWQLHTVNDLIKIIGIGLKLKCFFSIGGISYGILSKHLPPQFQIQKAVN